MKKINLNVVFPALALFIWMVYSCKTGINTHPDEFFLPGQSWQDTDGKPIEAHGGGILQIEGVYYWYGENHQLGTGNKTGISCYSSSDLFHWKNAGVVFPKDSLPEAFRDSGVCERPKVLFNAKTGKYVMWMHLDGRNYTLASAGVAISDKPTGPFSFIKSFKPVVYDYGYKLSRGPEFDTHEKLLGNTFRDMNLFRDDNGKAYVFYASEDNASLYVVQLNDDYTDAEQPLVKGKNWERILPEAYREAPAPFKYKGKYYLITSGLTGWAPNPARYHIADSIMGPWKTFENPCIGPGAETTFRSQSTFVIKAPECQETDFIFMGDRWNGTDLFSSTMVWLPFRIKDDGSFRLEFTDKWNLSVFNTNEKIPPAPAIRLLGADTSSTENFSIQWEAVPGAIGYRVLENDLYTGITTATQFTLPSRLAGSNCTCSVIAFSLDTISASSNTVHINWNKAADTWLSDVEPVSWKQGYGSLRKDVSLEGSTQQIRGKKFAKGLGTHAISEIIYKLSGRYTTFEAFVGVDDYPSFSKSPSMEFFVYGDNKLLWQSGVMHIMDQAIPVKVDITGINELKLIVGDAGDGTNYDHANWAEARILAGKGK
jgi:hypothetical protein